MSVKYLSLCVVSVAVAALVAGAVGIASKAASLVKKPAVSLTSLVIPQLKPERMTETSDFKLGLDVYKQRIASPASTGKSLPAALAALDDKSLVAGYRSANANQLFAGADEKSLALVAAGANPKPAMFAAQTQIIQPAGAKVAPAKFIPPGQGTQIDMPKVAVVVIDGQTNKAIVNGSLVTVNSQLYGGYVVKEINIDSVVITHGKEQYVIRIPLDRLRVLGAPEAVRSKGV